MTGLVFPVRDCAVNLERAGGRSTDSSEDGSDCDQAALYACHSELADRRRALDCPANKLLFHRLVTVLLGLLVVFTARAMYYKRCISYGNSVCLSVRLSVRPSHAGIVSKRRHVARCSLHRWIAKCV